MKTISNETEYNAIVKRIDELLEIVTDENYNTVPEAIELDFLSELVEEYENKYYPITQSSTVDVTTFRRSKMRAIVNG
jgi:HTH-type transcriptional regulator/antitoxin HigA